MATGMADHQDEQIQAAFQGAQRQWIGAIRAHRFAPPDAGFSARLAALSDAARAEADICRTAHTKGYIWPRHRAAGSEPPPELRPDSGRRGPDALWQRFDAAVDHLNRVTSKTNLRRVADAYEELAYAAGELAEAFEAEDRASGLLIDSELRRSA
jgi:hypothetical protein